MISDVYNLGGPPKLYSNYHTVDVLLETGLSRTRNILIEILKKQQCLEVRLRDQNDFSFNYTTSIDWVTFQRMKDEQNLEICFEEFHLQFIDLLKQTILKQMLLKLEQSAGTCRVIFYEKSKIKCLIFLIIDLNLTDQKDIIDEMVTNIRLLKETNHNINSELNVTKNALGEKEALLNTALLSHRQMKKKCIENIASIEAAFSLGIETIHHDINLKINNLNKRLNNLSKDVNLVKTEHKYQENIYSQAIFQLEQFKRDNERNYKIIDSLKSDIENLNCQKLQSDKKFIEYTEIITKKDLEIEALKTQRDELRKDMQEATLIIAQKTKTHDEIAKDLVQANTMLVNFNKQYDMISKDVEYLQNLIKSKDEAFEKQVQNLKCLKDDYDRYRKEYSADNFNTLQRELRRSHERMEELEKHNREATKINGLLTKKLANGDLFDVKNMQWAAQPK